MAAKFVESEFEKIDRLMEIYTVRRQCQSTCSLKLLLSACLVPPAAGSAPSAAATSALKHKARCWLAFRNLTQLRHRAQEYQGRVAAEERRLATSGEEYTDEDMGLARLDAGLYTLQQVGFTAAP